MSKVLTRENKENYNAGETYKYNRVENPGPLAKLNPQAAASFRSGMYNVHVLDEPTILYRSGHSEYGPFGGYYTRNIPSSVLQTRIDNAIKPIWINARTEKSTGISPIDTYYEFLFPTGTTMYEGNSGYQEGIYLGGGNQIYIHNADKIKGVKILNKKPLK